MALVCQVAIARVFTTLLPASQFTVCATCRCRRQFTLHTTGSTWDHYGLTPTLAVQCSVKTPSTPTESCNPATVTMLVATQLIVWDSSGIDTKRVYQTQCHDVDLKTSVRNTKEFHKEMVTLKNWTKIFFKALKESSRHCMHWDKS